MDYNYSYKSPEEIKDEAVYQRIGMAVISAQRVEFVTTQLLEILAEFDKDIYGITTDEFLNNSKEAKKARKTLGKVFNLLKLNPKLIIEHELNDYLEKRNLLIHGFWRNYLNTKSEKQKKTAIDFCNSFGRQSERIESFFKGFLYFLSLRHVKDSDHLSPGIKQWEKDFDYFMNSLQAKEL